MEFLCTTEQFLVHPSFESPGSDFVFLSAVGNSRYVITTHPRSSFTLLKLIILQEYSLVFKPSYCPDLDYFSGGAWKGLGMRPVNTHGAHCVGASPLSLVPGARVVASPLSLVPGTHGVHHHLASSPARVWVHHHLASSPARVWVHHHLASSPARVWVHHHLASSPARMWVYHHSAANFFCA